MTQGVLKTHGICLMMYFKNNWNAGPFFLLHGYFRRKKTYIYIYIYIRLKIKPNSVRIRFYSCQIFVLPSTGFEPTPLLHCSTIRLALRPAP